MLTDGAAEVDGLPEGAILILGLLDKLGILDGSELGVSDGKELGLSDGISDILGILVGDSDGETLVDGCTDGVELGTSEGRLDGIELGTVLGIYEG